MSLIDRVKKILKEAPERTPDQPSGLDFEGQSKKFVKNEKNKKKTMRNLEPKGPKQGELDLGNTSTTNTPLSTKRTLKGRPLGSKTKPKGETYKQQSFKIQKKSLIDKTKKYAAGEYPKIGGGGLKPDIKKPIKGTTPVKTNVSKVNVDKIFSGAGNVKKGGIVPDKNISPKSKGSTPVKTNISKVNVDKIFDKPKSPIKKTLGVKQSEVSKQAKEFTAKVNKTNVNVQKNYVGRKAVRIKDATGGKKTGSFSKGNLSFPGDRSGAYQSTKSDLETKKLLKKAGASGDVSPTAGSKIRKRVETIRKTRADKLGVPDPFTTPTKGTKTKFGDIFKGSKIAKKFNPGGTTQFDISKTPVGKLKLPSPTVSPEAKRKRFDALSKDISKFSKRTRIAGSDIKDLKDVDKATMRTAPVNKVAVPGSASRYDVGMASRRITKKYAPGTTGKVQMRGGATNVPSGPKTPPVKYDIPPDPKPGKLVQGRDFSSKKSYDAKLEKQIKILRGKADNLRKKQLKVHKTKPISGGGRDIDRSKSLRKLGARMRERTKTADALEKSLKRTGTTGPTSMLPVVSGKGADAKMPGMGDKTYKQFYKDANVGKQYTPPKVKSTPKPPPVDPNVERTVKKTYNKSKVTTGVNLGNLRDTAKFQRRAARLSRGFGGNRGKRAAVGKVAKFALGAVRKNPLLATGLALGAYGLYQANKTIKNQSNPQRNASIASLRRLPTYTYVNRKTDKPVKYEMGTKNNPYGSVDTATSRSRLKADTYNPETNPKGKLKLLQTYPRKS